MKTSRGAPTLRYIVAGAPPAIRLSPPGYRHWPTAVFVPGELASTTRVAQPRSLLIAHPEVPTGIAVPTGNTALKSKSVRVVNPPGWLGHVPAGGGGGGTVTVITAVPVTPSLVAVIVAEPVATPITSPLPFTVATSVLLLTQVTTRPSSGLLFASRGVAVSCTVCPTGTLAGAGLTVTDATGTGVPVVVPLTTFDSPPNTAFTFSVPRNAINWN